MKQITILQSKWILPIYFLSLSLPVLLANRTGFNTLGITSLVFTTLSVAAIIYLAIKVGIAEINISTSAGFVFLGIIQSQAVISFYSVIDPLKLLYTIASIILMVVLYFIIRHKALKQH